MSTHKWQFSARFRRNIFGWRSQVPIQRIREAVSEIRKVSRKDPVLGAYGAVLFLEKISPARGSRRKPSKFPDKYCSFILIYKSVPRKFDRLM